MRTIALVLAAFVASAHAAAQSWKEYAYPDYAFSVAFPTDPQIETTTYQVADSRSVSARVYTVRQNNSLLKVTIAELANTGLQEKAVIDHAIKTLSAGGEVKFDIPHRIYRVADGSRSTMAVFDYKGRLYLISSSNHRCSPTAARAAPRCCLHHSRSSTRRGVQPPRAWTTHDAPGGRSARS